MSDANRIDPPTLIDPSDGWPPDDVLPELRYLPRPDSLPRYRGAFRHWRWVGGGTHQAVIEVAGDPLVLWCDGGLRLHAGYVESYLASVVVGQLGGVGHEDGDGHVRLSAAEIALWRAACRHQPVCGDAWRAAAGRREPTVAKGDPELLRLLGALVTATATTTTDGGAHAAGR